MTHRVMITLPDPLGEQLDQHAARSGQRASTAAGQLIRDALSRPGQRDTVHSTCWQPHIAAGRCGGVRFSIQARISS